MAGCCHGAEVRRVVPEARSQSTPACNEGLVACVQRDLQDISKRGALIGRCLRQQGLQPDESYFLSVYEDLESIATRRLKPDVAQVTNQGKGHGQFRLPGV